ncbi:MAG: nickel-dependent malate racemase, LarAH6 family [Bacillota bacterium]
MHKRGGEVWPCCHRWPDADMELRLKYGKSEVEAVIPDKNVAYNVEPKEFSGVPDPLQAVRQAVQNPIGCPRIGEIVAQKKPKSVAIVVNDVTRPTPYEYMLPPIMEELHGAGIKAEQITFVVATGIHRGNTLEENRKIFTSAIVDRYHFVNHDCQGDLASVGNLPDGTELKINREVAEADMVITTGLIQLHYFAGYSGGRKSILPGIVGKDMITSNHALMTEPGATTGCYKKNPVHWIMMEAARKVGVDFIVNVVTNSNKEIVMVAAGDLEQAWLTGVKVCEEMSVVKIPDQVDVVIASAGGSPKDMNVYQAQKALENAEGTVKKGGTIILVAQCVEGYGEDTFEEWVRSARKLEDIFERFNREFVLGGHKAFAIAKVLVEKQVIMVSDLSHDDTEELFFTYAADLQKALEYVAKKHGPDYKAIVMPEAGLVLPVIE